MWENARALPFGRLSIRNMCTFAAAVLAASFLFVVFISPIAHAADAEWNGDSIMYSGNEYAKAVDAKAGDGHNLPVGTLIYRYDEPTASSPSNPTTKAHLIYFAPGTDPTKAVSATHVVYDFTPPNTFTNPSGQAPITLGIKQATSEGTTSCAVEGIGWIVCPVTRFLASAMDHLFDILAELLTVRPVQTNQDNSLYRAWSYMRNFANVSFVIAFLIIIYSQLTTIGLSNYDIKKMLPRLIVAAVLVNVSYWICAIAIDVSNIFGWSIQEIFISMRNNLVGAEGNGWTRVLDFESVAGAILSGGTATAAVLFGAYGLLLSAGTLTGALYMLLPILVGVIVAVLVALLVMAARQAIITILVIVSPLAFVAYLLPNTEKYYEKWQQLGLTMLLLFPIFSVIFGGSQLAGTAIIQAADSINLILLGMAVQVAPVVVTPLLLKFSGSILARISGAINNPGKGLIDRTRRFAEERRDQNKARAFAGPLNRKRDVVARLGRNLDTRKRTREGWQKANEAVADGNWTNSRAYSDIQQQAMSADLIKNRGEADAQTRFEASKRTSAVMQNLELDARASKLNLDLSKARVDADWEEIKAGDARRMVEPAGLSTSALAAFAHTRNNLAKSLSDRTIDTAVEARRSQSAQHVQQTQFSTALEATQALRNQAGGIDSNGAQRALANALRERHEQRGEAVKNANSIIYHSNLSDDKILAVAQNNAAGMGLSFEVSKDVQEAAIKMVAGAGNVKNINALVESLDLSPAGDENHRIALVDALKNNNGARPKYISFGMMDKMQQGIPSDLKTPGVDQMIIDTIVEGKFAPETIVQQDKYALIRISEAIARNKPSYTPAQLVALTKFKKQIGDLYASDILNVKIGERDAPLQDILSRI